MAYPSSHLIVDLQTTTKKREISSSGSTESTATAVIAAGGIVALSAVCGSCTTTFNF